VCGPQKEEPMIKNTRTEESLLNRLVVEQQPKTVLLAFTNQSAYNSKINFTMVVSAIHSQSKKSTAKVNSFCHLTESRNMTKCKQLQETFEKILIY